MATTETKILDNVISSRRALLLGGGALAALALTTRKANAYIAPASYTDNDILNFALNLEYLEANFYWMAAFGTTIDKPNGASTAAITAALGSSASAAAIAAATAPIGLNGVLGSGLAPNTTAGVSAMTTGANRVPFTTIQVASYAVETAIEEGRHVSLLRSALGSLAAAQPTIDITPGGAFTAVANAAGIAGTFNPYASDANFLIGAYIFEDVGVTAYHGAAPLIKSQATLGTAASILAVEAYHGGLIRTTINQLDPVNANNFLLYTDQISALRSKLSQAAPSPAFVGTDDFGLTSSAATPTVYFAAPTLGTTAATGGFRTETADQDANALAFNRTTTSVLNIVTGGGAAAAGTLSKGVFFPSGLNGLFV